MRLLKGWFDTTLPPFLIKHADKKVTLLHIDSDLYSSAIFVLRSLANNNQFAKDCVIVFDELFNYDGFDGNNGELRAWYDFIHEYNVTFTWIGSASEIDLVGYRETLDSEPYSKTPEQCALTLHQVTTRGQKSQTVNAKDDD